jgi:transcription antitermination factor NusG
MPQAWYAVYTKFHHEKSAAGMLVDKSFDVFLPIYRVVHRWKDRNQSLILPLFPCYFFIQTQLERRLDILRTAGVRWLVAQAGRACPVPDEEIDAVRRICASSSSVRPHALLKQGDLVRIKMGALAGMEGILIRTKNQYRVVITVQLLQKSVSVEVELSNVESATPLGHTPRPIARESMQFV